MTSTNQPTRLTRAFVRFQNNPSSVRYAAAAIISTTAVFVIVRSVLVGGVRHRGPSPQFVEALATQAA